MYAIATFLVVAVITIIFTKLATGALIATGMPPHVASFQARSAFSGAGFTTTEAENVVNHPIRRQIIMAAMFAGALGTPTLVVSVLIGFVAPGPGSTRDRALVAAAGVTLIMMAAVNRPATKALERLGNRYAQSRLMPALEGSGHELLSLSDDYVIAAAEVSERRSEAPRSLRGLDEALPGVTVLGVRRGQTIIGESPTDFTLDRGDALIVFGRRQQLMDLGLVDQAN
ncbi:MAG: TrkA C-terminal domain-containing protein [Acidimicrobiales bacterium]